MDMTHFPSLTCLGLFRPADLTYLHLFSPTSTYFVSQKFSMDGTPDNYLLQPARTGPNYCKIPPNKTSLETIMGKIPRTTVRVCIDPKHGISGREKQLNINILAGWSRDWVGVEKLFMCFSAPIPFWGGGNI